jgi:hypothetical protein
MLCGGAVPSGEATNSTKAATLDNASKGVILPNQNRGTPSLRERREARGASSLARNEAASTRRRREGAELQELDKRVWRDAIRRLKPFEESVCADQVNDETRPRKPNTAASILDIPVDRGESYVATYRAGIFMRLRREWTNLGALITLHANIVVSNTRDRAFGRDCGFQKPTQPLRERIGAHTELAERVSIGVEDSTEAFVRSQKTRLGKAARAHPGFHFFQRDAAFFVSLCQSVVIIRLAAIGPPAVLAVLAVGACVAAAA